MRGDYSPLSGEYFSIILTAVFIPSTAADMIPPA